MKEKKVNLTDVINKIAENSCPLFDELDKHPYLSTVVNGLVEDFMRHDSNLDDLCTFKIDIESRVDDLEERVAKLEQVKAPVAQEATKLPQDVIDFLRTFVSISCDDINCKNCQFHIVGKDYTCLQNRAFELLDIYSEQK